MVCSMKNVNTLSFLNLKNNRNFLWSLSNVFSLTASITLPKQCWCDYQSLAATNIKFLFRPFYFDFLLFYFLTFTFSVFTLILEKIETLKVMQPAEWKQENNLRKRKKIKSFYILNNTDNVSNHKDFQFKYVLNLVLQSLVCI